MLTSALYLRKTLTQPLFMNTMRKAAFSVGIGYPPKKTENPVAFKFIYQNSKQTKEVLAREGETILEVAKNNNIELEGACE